MAGCDPLFDVGGAFFPGWLLAVFAAAVPGVADKDSEYSPGEEGAGICTCGLGLMGRPLLLYLL